MKTKTIFLIGTLAVISTAHAQGFSADNLANNKLLYVGFDNKVSFQQNGCKHDNFKIESVNCSVSKLEDAQNKDIYIIKADRTAHGKTAKVYMIADEKKVDSVLFDVVVLPVPSIYWGNQQAGSKFSNSNEMQIKYASGIPLKSTFKIVKWESEFNGKKITGEGHLLSSEFINLTKSMTAGGSVKITAYFKGADSITRKMNGFWIKE